MISNANQHTNEGTKCESTNKHTNAEQKKTHGIKMLYIYTFILLNKSRDSF